MIELTGNALVLRFPEVHDDAVARVDFQRTLRIPDDGTTHFLPPGLGSFPLRHVDDFADRVPDAWSRHGGVMLPMYQAEAMWMNFSSPLGSGAPAYPIALKIATGRIDAISGEEWTGTLGDDPQDYVVVPEQPWLDGFCVEEGVIRQFVAMPLGAGYSVEEQVTGRGEFGGVQIMAVPMKRGAYELLVAREERRLDGVVFSASEDMPTLASAMDMGLAPGGRMRQEIHEDPHGLDVWDLEHASRCFVHLTNALVWRAITGDDPPTPPPTAKEYTDAGLPWFDHYAELPAVEGSKVLAELKSVLETGRERGDVPLPENERVAVDRVVRVGPSRRPRVRDGAW